MTSIRHSCYPEKPCISRFVAPWDTSGWYAAGKALGIGTTIYTNAPVHVLALPQAYVGADYIRMFDSESEGFDDKQEVCFRAERDVIVGVAMPPMGAYPEWLKDYQKTEECLVTELGAWPVYERGFSSGDLVVIPGMEGEGHHDFPMIRPVRQEACAPLPFVPWESVRLPSLPERKYASLLAEVFPDAQSLAHYETQGCAWVGGAKRGIRVAGRFACRASSLTDRFVLIAAVSFDMESHGRLALLSEKKSPLFSLPLSPSADGDTLAIRLIVNVSEGTIKVWLNNRFAHQAPLTLSETLGFVAFEAEKGALTLHHLYLQDDTEIYAAYEDMASMSREMTVITGHARRVPFPFEERGSVELGGNTAVQYGFPAMEKCFTIETKVRCETEDFCLVPVLIDENGAPLLKIALYRNNLYATNGAVWRRLIGEETDWMYYPCGNWLLISVKVHPRQGTYDLFVDGARRAAGFSLDHGAKAVCSAGFFCDAESKLYVERIRIYDDADFSRGMLPSAPLMDVRRFGAVGDGVTMDTAAIQAAVDAASPVGGTVYLANGVYLSGSISLRSDITFWVDPTAVLLGMQDHAQYPLYQPGTSLCAVRQLGRGLLYGEKLHNVRITGGGMLDGNGLYRFKENDPVLNRPERSRPCMIYLTYSSEITIENINFRRSCFWTLVPLSCRNVLLRHLNLDCMYTPNRDGIDPVDVCDMTIYDCAIMAGDDGLCFKSSDPFGCRRIDVHDLMIQSLASGIKFGTDTYDSLTDTTVTDCSIKNVNRCGISLEAVDGAEVSRVLFDRIDMVDVGAPAYVVVGRRNRVPRGNAPIRHAAIDGVLFRRLRFEKPYLFSYSRWIHEVMVVGQSENQPVRNVCFRDCFFGLPGGCADRPDKPGVIDDQYPEYDSHGMSAGSAFTARYTENFTVENLTLTLEKPDQRPALAVFDSPSSGA